jgi:hypothetical protein
MNTVDFSRIYRNNQTMYRTLSPNPSTAPSTSFPELVTTRFLNELSAKPQPLQNIEGLIANSGAELKHFYAGNELGYRRGFDAGHGRGLLLGFIAAMVLLKSSSAKA